MPPNLPKDNPDNTKRNTNILIDGLTTAQSGPYWPE